MIMSGGERMAMLRMAFEVDGRRKRVRLKMTWKKQVEEESLKVGLRREDAFC